jgi:hypothetical protein
VIGLRLLLVSVAATVAAALYLTANAALYRYVIPLPADLGGDGSRPADVLPAVCAAVVGFGVGLLRRRTVIRRADPYTPPKRLSTGWWFVLAALVGLLGMMAVPEFVRIGAELATSRFVPAESPTADSGERVTVELGPGRHAVFRPYGRDTSVAQCDLTDGAGRDLPLTEPSVPFTDNNDSIVTLLLGTFDVPAAGPVTVECRGDPSDIYQVAGLPEIQGPLEPLVYVPTALLSGIGVLPGVLLAGLVLARRFRPDNTTRSSVVDA